MPKTSNTPTPPETLPQDTPGVGMDEGALGDGATGLYFTKAPRIDAWHAFDQQHDAVGMILPAPADTSKWAVRIGKRQVPTTFSSATAARAYLMGWHDRDEMAQADAPGTIGRETIATAAPGTGRDPQKPEGGFDASGATTVTA